ncbi:MAG TPA: 5'-nucleotidase C-terminal domain-containing protein [Clostridia bacterium]|nr:5'-nucleotidase C-terminal domain-containing protein [Clostridia bacterium]
MSDRLAPDAGTPGAFSVLFGDTAQSYVDPADPNRLEFEYVQRLTEALDATVLGRPSEVRLRVVHIGGAGMTIPRWVEARRPHTAQLVLEPDADLTAEVRRKLPLGRGSGIKVREVGGREGIAAMPPDYADAVMGTAVLKGGFSGKSLPHARLWFDPQKNAVVKKECFLHHTDRDAAAKDIYRAYEQRVTSPFDAFFSEALAVADEKWTLRLSAETKLGNFLADCMREGAGVEIAYMNATSAGGYIEPGPVTAQDIVSVMGFNDPIHTSKISGSRLYRLFELVYEPERFGNNAGLLYSGVVVYADHTRPGGQKILGITLRDGTPVEPGREYTIATSEYMAFGGNDTSLVANGLAWTNTGVRIHDAIFAYLRKYGRMHVSPEQRMHEIGRPENDNAPF